MTIKNQFLANTSQFNTRHFRLESVTTALNGSVRVRDSENNEHRFVIPFAIARLLVKEYGSRPVVPLKCAITFFTTQGKDYAISVEIGIAGEEFESRFPKVLTRIEQELGDDNIMFDGRYLFVASDADIEAASDIAFISPIDDNGTYVPLTVKCIDCFQPERQVFDKLIWDSRDCLIMRVEHNGHIDGVLLPPIWQSASVLGAESDEDEEVHEIDMVVTDRTFEEGAMQRLDRFYGVNVMFVIAAGRGIADQFGYQSVDILQLPDLMIRLNTVNVTSIEPAMKRLLTIGLAPSVALSWLAGCLYRATKPDQVFEVRRLIKYLTSKGLTSVSRSRLDNILIDYNSTETLPPQVTYNHR